MDLDKGTDEDPDVRCRLVARDFEPKGEKDREDLFAAMPPLECKKVLFRKAVQMPRRGGKKMKLLFIDVKKAHLNAFLEEGEHAYIDLPEEDAEMGMCGRLRRWLYGMRPAASAWEKDYTDNLESIGFRRGRAAPTVFYNSATSTRCVVHGDDFTFLGYDDDLRDIIKAFGDWYEIKVRGILGGGGGCGEQEEITILNRKVRWVGNVIEYEADDKHAKILCNELGLADESNGLGLPIVKETLEDLQADDDALNGIETTRFRGLAARANYLGQDRTDVQYAAKEICREMARPKNGSWKKLKRLGRYLLEFPRLVWSFEGVEGSEGQYIDVFSDSDWAGCLRTRRSTSGGIVTLDGGVVKSWSGTQATIATSSGEAEYYALVKAAAEGLGVKAVMEDMGWNMKVRIWIDSTAAKSVASRIGLGRVRHMEIKYLWIQEATKAKRIELQKIDGKLNPADVLTKPKTYEEAQNLLKNVGTTIVRRKTWERCGLVRWADVVDFDKV